MSDNRIDPDYEYFMWYPNNEASEINWWVKGSDEINKLGSGGWLEMRDGHFLVDPADEALLFAWHFGVEKQKADNLIAGRRIYTNSISKFTHTTPNVFGFKSNIAENKAKDTLRRGVERLIFQSLLGAFRAKRDEAEFYGAVTPSRIKGVNAEQAQEALRIIATRERTAADTAMQEYATAALQLKREVAGYLASAVTFRDLVKRIGKYIDGRLGVTYFVHEFFEHNSFEDEPPAIVHQWEYAYHEHLEKELDKNLFARPIFQLSKNALKPVFKNYPALGSIYHLPDFATEPGKLFEAIDERYHERH